MASLWHLKQREVGHTGLCQSHCLPLACPYRVSGLSGKVKGESPKLRVRLANPFPGVIMLLKPYCERKHLLPAVRCSGCGTTAFSKRLLFKIKDAKTPRGGPGRTRSSAKPRGREGHVERLGLTRSSPEARLTVHTCCALGVVGGEALFVGQLNYQPH